MKNTKNSARPALRPAQTARYQSSRKKNTNESFCCCYRRPCSFWICLSRAVGSERTSPKAKLHRMDKTAHQQESRARNWDISLAADCIAKTGGGNRLTFAIIVPESKAAFRVPTLVGLFGW